MKIRSSWRLRHPLAAPGACRQAVRREAGQALVELALSITFISLLLGAAIDLGLAYKTYQTLMNATAEAGTFLALNPAVNCDTHSTWCAGTDAIGGADREARNRFREEQGTALHGSASTLDLNSDRIDDTTQTIDGMAGWVWIGTKVKLDEATSDDVTMSGGVYGVSAGFTGTTDSRCLQRYRFNLAGKQCFIVVRTEMIYHPYITSRLLGNNMPIHAVSVKPIVGGP